MCLPPVRGVSYYPLVVGYRLGVAAEHVQRVRPKRAGSALLLAVLGGLQSPVEELEGLRVVGGVEGSKAGVYEHVRIIGMGARPPLEGGARQARLAYQAVVTPELHEGVRVLGVGSCGPFQVMDHLERLVVAHGEGSEAHAGCYPVGVELQSVEEAGLCLLGTVKAQERPAYGFYYLRVLGLKGQRLLEARECLFQETLSRERLALLQKILELLHRAH